VTPWSVRTRGFLLAYVIPLISFIAGAVAGHIAGVYFGVPSMDVPAGFMSLISTSWRTFRMLGRLDKTSQMSISRIVRESAFDPDYKSDEAMRFEELR